MTLHRQKARPYLSPAIGKTVGKLAQQREIAIIESVGLHFRQTIRVRVERPRWMPGRIYRWLMRTIVVDEGPLRVGTDPR